MLFNHLGKAFYFAFRCCSLNSCVGSKCVNQPNIMQIANSQWYHWIQKTKIHIILLNLLEFMGIPWKSSININKIHSEIRIQETSLVLLVMQPSVMSLRMCVVCAINHHRNKRIHISRHALIMLIWVQCPMYIMSACLMFAIEFIQLTIRWKLKNSMNNQSQSNYWTQNTI